MTSRHPPAASVRAVAAAVLALVVVVATGCRAPSTTGTGSATAAGSATSTAPGGRSAGCGTAVAGGTDRRTVTSGGTERAYLRTMPDGDDGRTPRPVVIDLHGLGEPAQAHLEYSKLATSAARRGWVGVTPESVGGRRGGMWTIAPLPGPDDVGFVRDLLDQLGREVCVDPTRVYAAGISNGAAFTGVLSCQLGDRLAAVGMVAGPNAYRPCEGTTPVALAAFHGTDDPIIPYDGGALFAGMRGRGGRQAGRASELLPDAGDFGGERTGGVASAEDALAGWAARNGCQSAATRMSVAPHVTRIAYADCTHDAETELYRIEGGGHTWPGAAPIPGDPFGTTTNEIDATAVLLDFFADHQR